MALFIFIPKKGIKIGVRLVVGSRGIHGGLSMDLIVIDPLDAGFHINHIILPQRICSKF